VRYRRGIVVDGHGFPDWVPYARAVVALPEPAATRDRAETRILDVLTANAVMVIAGDPLWQGDDTLRTPDGWTWAHLPRLLGAVHGETARGEPRRVALVPVDLHGSYRHLGGVATNRVGRAGRGPDLAGAPAVAWERVQRLTDTAVQKVEVHLGYGLPPAYREFLVASNGGRPTAPAVHPKLGFVADQRPFGLAREDWQQDLVYANGWFGDRLTEDFLAIGYVQGGLLALRVRGGDTGSVWYCDDDDPRDSDGYDAAEVCARLLHRCADDCTAFLAQLRVVPRGLRTLAVALARRGLAEPLRPDGMAAALPRTRQPAALPAPTEQAEVEQGGSG
jgi:hypothetical protein